MHSSRMHTVSLLPVSPSMHRGGDTCQGGVHAMEVYLPGGVYRQLVARISQHAPRGGYLPGGVPARGVYLPWKCTCQGGVPA